MLDSRRAGYRLSAGGRIDRARSLAFRWNGRTLAAFAGDTLASALLANGVRIAGRSFKFHRPRGILTAGPEEPNALVTLNRGAFAELSARATMVPVHDGLEAHAQNCWPHVEFDVAGVLDTLSPLLQAGFYNKTFKWPSWRFYEPFVRAAAGLGRVPKAADPDRYEGVNAHCDLLVVGGGPAGLRISQQVASRGLRVILAEQDPEFGGQLLATSTSIDGRTASAWLDELLAELRSRPNVTLLSATTVFGLYDHGTAGLLERVSHGERTSALRERYSRIRARQIALATGAIEQPLVFENNDLPGILLAGAIRHYANRYAVAAGERIVFATNNDSAYVAAQDLVRAGVDVPLLIDSRPEPPEGLTLTLRLLGVDVRAGAVVLKASGDRGLSGLRFGTLGADSSALSTSDVACDALGMSGGWSPAVHLFSHARGALDFDPVRQCFVPRPGTAPVQCAGSLTGTATLAETLNNADAVAYEVLRQAGHTSAYRRTSAAIEEPAISASVGPLRRTPIGQARRQWIDFQHDVTVADIQLALAEGYEAIEHLKRYTTLGMSVDQGKTGNLNALLTVAELTRQSPKEVGTTTYRPPYTPVTLGALAAGQTGERYAPRRLLPAHGEHKTLGARWLEAGGWTRPTCYPRSGESLHAAIERETLAVRTRVGLFDTSPLGKIEVTGADAASFLDRFYINNVMSLEVGRVRYGLMLNENGIIIDDGTIARLGPRRFVITTTSGGAGRIAQWLEHWRQCEWPELEVFTTPVTTQWATMAIAGPHARDVLTRLSTDICLDRDSLPHLHVREGTFAGVPTRLYRVSFSGELGYEINVPSGYGASLWRALLEAGEQFGIVPYGLETLLLLRLEKGFLHLGADTDGTTVPADVGWGGVVLKKTADFIGKRSLTLAENRRPDRLQLIGLTLDDPQILVAGAHLRLRGTSAGSDGWVTSAAHSPTLGKRIALAMLRGGHSRLGERITIHDLDRSAQASVTSTTFYDAEGRRPHA